MDGENFSEMLDLSIRLLDDAFFQNRVREKLPSVLAEQPSYQAFYDKVCELRRFLFSVSRGDLPAQITFPGPTADCLMAWMDKHQRLTKQVNFSQAVLSESKKYLGNIQLGLLLLNEDLAVCSQYSKFSSYLFHERDIAHAYFSDLIYPDIDQANRDRAEMDVYLRILFSNQTATAEMLSDANPLRNKLVTIKDPCGYLEDRVVKISFQRIFEQGVVVNIMVLMEDKTDVVNEEKEREKETARKNREIESLTAILKQGPVVFFDFIQETRAILDKDIIKLEPIGDRENLTKLFGSLHSLKGLARLLELNHMAECFHGCETIVSQIRAEGRYRDGIVIEEFNRYVGSILTELQNIEALLEKIMSFQHFPDSVAARGAISSISSFVVSLHEMIKTLAKEVGKDIEFRSNVTIDEFPLLNKVRGAITLLVRNAIDHGIEEKNGRLALNKRDRGLVSFNVYRNEFHYFVEVSDDGNGIDFNRIRKIAVEKKLLEDKNSKITDDQLLKLLFSPDFSCKEQLTQISGRGMGLNKVKDDVARLNGEIIVWTQKGKGTKFTMKFPIIENIIQSVIHTVDLENDGLSLERLH